MHCTINLVKTDQLSKWFVPANPAGQKKSAQVLLPDSFHIRYELNFKIIINLNYCQVHNVCVIN